MRDAAELFTIGQVARLTNVPIRTIRFWSDAGLLPPTERTHAGYRLFDGDTLARLDLLRTLRELGLGLDTIKRLLRQQTTVSDVAQVHVQALETQIRALRLQRAVLQMAAKRTASMEEVILMNKRAKLSAQERQHMIDQFVQRAFAGLPESAPGAQIAHGMRQLPAELPDDPSAEQIDAWVELAEMVQDPGFQQRVRQMALDGASGQATAPISGTAGQNLPQLATEHVAPAVEAGVRPESEEAQLILEHLLPPRMTPEQRRELADDLERFSDPRVERYWQLLGVLNGWPPLQPRVRSFEWVVSALRAQG